LVNHKYRFFYID